MKQGWQIKKLGCLCSFERGLTYSKGDEVSISTKGVLRSNNVDLSSNTLNFDEIKYLKDDIDIPVSKKVKRNSILMCMSNGSKAHLGKVAIIEDDLDYAFGGFMGLLVPDEDAVFPRYFYYALITPIYKSFIKSLSDGANINNLKFADLKEFEIPVPSISEQQRIVALLDAEFAKIDALKANAEKNLQNAKDLFQAALKKELEPKEGWNKDLLSNVAYISRGRSQHRPRNEASLYGGDYPFIQTGDIRDANGKTITTYNQTYSEIGLQQSRLWKKGTICITIAANIGETAILGMDACFPDSVVGIIPDNQIVCTDFLNYCLIKEKDELNEIAHGTAQKNINVAILEKVLITYPIDSTIQQSIVKQLDALNGKCTTLQANYEKTLSLCDDLKQALLKKAFNGEI